jgi:hypothetical protein
MSKTVFPQAVKPWVDEYEAKNECVILDRSGVSIYVPLTPTPLVFYQRHSGECRNPGAMAATTSTMEVG